MSAEHVEPLPSSPVGPTAAEAGEDRDLLARADALIAALSQHPDPAVGAQVEELLAGIDAIHRTALTHLVGAIQAMAGDDFLHRLIADPAIRLLLMSYGLLAVDRRLQTEEVLDRVRGAWHARGVDFVLEDVVGGAVYVRLHGLERSGADVDAVRGELESALADGLLGFQQLELGGRQASGGSRGLVQLGGRRPLQRPVYRRLLAAADLEPGSLRGVDVDGVPVLLVRLGDGEVHALANHCGDTPLPLTFSGLDGDRLRCSWHGCLYDVRTGKRVDGGEERLAVYPVALVEGGVEVALGVEPAPADAAAVTRPARAEAAP